MEQERVRLSIQLLILICNRMKLKHTLKLSAMTGTAAKHIGGSTKATMFGFSNENDARKLQSKFEKVTAMIMDDVKDNLLYFGYSTKSYRGKHSESAVRKQLGAHRPQVVSLRRSFNKLL